MTREQETTQPQAADPGQPDGVDKGRLVGLAIMTFGAFIGALCQALVVPALPAIISDLGVDAARGQWMVTLYLLVTGVMIPVTGFLIDKLSAEELDAIIVWEPAATAAAADELQNGTFVRLDSRPLDLPTVLFGLAVLREDAFLRNQLDAAIQQLVSDGTVEDLLAKHGLPGRAPR